LEASHREWWHNFYPASFLSLPNTRLESFYWIQMYKLASATREDRPAIDLMGPWFNETPWPRIWWNLNLQLTYYPVYAANHLELGESMCRMIDNGKGNLAKNAKEFAEDSESVGRTTGYDCRGSVN
jgi:alpha-L-fucosidase 2